MSNANKLNANTGWILKHRFLSFCYFMKTRKTREDRKEDARKNHKLVKSLKAGH